MTDNVIAFPSPEPRNANALIVEILQEVADGVPDERLGDWPARLEEWASGFEDPWQELSKFGVMVLLLHATALLETRGDVGLQEYIAYARQVWPGAAE